MGEGEFAQSPVLYGAVVSSCVLGTVLATRYVAGRWDSWVRRRRGLRAQAGERAALRLLTQAGFDLIGRQQRTRWSCWVDGQQVYFDLIADYLLTRGGQRWVAEVKRGDTVADIRHGPTRRQMLEYQQAFSAAGLVLVDAGRGKLQHIEFAPLAGQEAGPGVRAFAWFALGLALGACLGWALAHHGPELKLL